MEAATQDRIIKPAEAYAASEEKTLRQTASPIRLLLQAAGGPRQWAGKLIRLLRTIGIFLNRREVARRLARLQSQGYLTQIPTRVQLITGGLDMVRFFITPGAKDYYATRGIHFGFHQVLRIIDDPVSMIDPVGLLSDRDTIIGHILQVVHANPVYDCQILDMFVDGLEELEKQTAQMVDGTHPRAKTIGAIIEDPEYHTRLLGYVKEFRKNQSAPEMRRRAGNARQDRNFVLAEETFGSLTGAMRYMNRLPKSWGAAFKHLTTVKVMPEQYCDPDKVALVRKEFGLN